MKLLNTGATNSKILKSQNGTKFKIASLSLYPNNIICAGAKAAGCMKLCLKDSGFSEIFKSVNEARQKKTDLYMNDPALFIALLHKEIAAFIRKTEKQGFKAVFRLNTISDIDWIKEGIPQQYPDAVFYDYSKRVNTLDTGLANYRKIFSFSAEPKYQGSVKKALLTNIPVAVVFRGYVPVGKYYLGREIINGDKSDIDNSTAFNKICGLTLKGSKNKKQTGLFIVDPMTATDCPTSQPACFKHDLIEAGLSRFLEVAA